MVSSNEEVGLIRIGIVGCGRILAAHLRGFRLLREAGERDFSIVALASRQPRDAWSYVDRHGNIPQRPAVSPIAGDPLAIGDEYLSDFQDSTNVEVFASAEELIGSPKVDAVMDLTTHSLHHVIAERTFRQKKHLLSQKPLAATVQAARQMVEQADEAGVVFGTFECFRFLDTTRALDWLFRSGRGGSLQMMTYGYLGAWWAPNLVVAETPWRHSKREGGGITIDIGVHFFDQMRVLAGNPIIITGRARVIEPRRRLRDQWIVCDADDTVWAQAEFERGVTAQVLASWAGQGGATTFGSGSVFHGTKARVDGSEVTWEEGSRQNVVDLFRKETAPNPSFATDDWFALGQHDWLEAIRQNRSPVSSGKEGLMNLAASWAILESNHAGRSVRFEEVLSGELAAAQAPIDRRLGLRTEA